MPELTVKTFLSTVAGQEDIRRFTIRTEDVTVAILAEKVRTAYDLQPSSFKLCWKDSEGDAVTVACDEDLRSVINEAKDVLKLHVFRVSSPVEQSRPAAMEHDAADSQKSEDKAGPSAESVPEDPDLHKGVTCDGCSNALRGIRYKCLICADYDLCAECEGKGIHNEHLTLKIPKPNLPGVMPIVMLSRALRHASEMAAQGQQSYNSAMGSMPNPQDFMDMSALGQQLCTMLQSLGVDASYFVQPPFGRPSPFGACPRSDSRPSGCPFSSGGCTSQQSAAAAAAVDRRVTETLEHLRAMGFQDDNGSLSNLVRSKSGDLFAVLDALKAQQKA